MSDISNAIANRFDSRACFDTLYTRASEHLRRSPEAQLQMQKARELCMRSASGDGETVPEQFIGHCQAEPEGLTFSRASNEPLTLPASSDSESVLSFPAPMLDALRAANHVYVFTGAGVSAESGIPTFRDKLTGLWERYEPSELSTPNAFRRDPPLVWGWHEMQRWTANTAKPNPAHLAIAELSKSVQRLTLVTQNVDSLHEQAGNKGVIHLHGSLQEPRCIDCSAPFTQLPVISAQPEEGTRIKPPYCPVCSGLIRPGVVWFGEPLPDSQLNNAFEAAIESDVMIVIGTSGVVYPAAEIPRFAWQAGCVVIHINMQPVDTRPEREFSLTGPAGSVLPRLLAAAFS